jgi:hypothetical protein
MNGEPTNRIESKYIKILEGNLDKNSGFRYQNQLRKIRMCKYILSIAKGHTKQWVIDKTADEFGLADDKIVVRMINRLIEEGDLKVVIVTPKE